MAEKLAQASWTTFTKKHKLDLDDAALVKGLAKFEATSDDKPEPRLAALDDIVEQVKKQTVALAKRKKELGDKPFNEAKDKLDGLLEAAESTLKTTRAAAARNDKNDKYDKNDDGDDDDSPSALTTKMVPLLRELRKGEVRMSALICTAGKNTAVLIMRKAISPSKRKMLAEAVDAKGGAKYIASECLLEEKVLTFIVQTQAAGLAKRLRQALMDQTGMRLKVRVRGEDGALDEDGQTEEADDAGAAGDGSEAQAPAAGDGTTTSAEQQAYVQRLAALREPLAQALRGQHPESTKLRAVLAFAVEKADTQHDYTAALKGLDTLAKLLAAPTGTPAGAAPAAAAADGTAAFNARLAALLPRVREAQAAGNPSLAEIRRMLGEAGVLGKKSEQVPAAMALLDQIEALLSPAGATPAAAPPLRRGRVNFAKARLEWDAAKNRVGSQLDTLRERILAEFPDRTDAVDRLKGVLGRFNEGLGETLSELHVGSEGAQRGALEDKAREVVDAYLDYVLSSELIEHVEDHPFDDVQVGVRDMLLPALKSVSQQLAPQ